MFIISFNGNCTVAQLQTYRAPCIVEIACCCDQYSRLSRKVRCLRLRLNKVLKFKPAVKSVPISFALNYTKEESGFKVNFLEAIT